MARRVVVAVYRDGLHAQTLQSNQHLFTEFATAEQHDFGGVAGQWGADGGHGGGAQSALGLFNLMPKWVLEAVTIPA